MKPVALALLLAAALGAHEIGTTQVTAAFDAQTYDITIATDASALAEKVAALTGIEAPRDTAAVAALLETNLPLIQSRIHLTFDSVLAAPRYTLQVDPPNDPLSAIGATLHLRGPLPPAATHFSWQFNWTFATYSLKITRPNSAPETTWLEGADASAPIPLATSTPTSALAIARQYLALGFTHILPLGLDHVLFVLGSYLLSRRTRDLLLQVTAFTLAHSITLGLSMAGWVIVRPEIVEPLIALSIAYVAIENIFLTNLKSWRLALVFTFGLLHGLGFAGALSETGLPPGQFLTALASFNLGVESAQLTLIAAAALLIGRPLSHHAWYRPRIVIPASAAIACMGLYWTVQRIAG